MADKIVLAIDRDQSTVEAYTVGIFVWMTIASFIAATMAGRLTLAAAIVVALPLSALALSAAVVVAALVFNPILHAVGLPRGPSNITPNSTLFLIGVTLAASYFATWPTWARVPAWIFLGTVMLNGVCSAVLFLLRHRVRAAELRCAA